MDGIVLANPVLGEVLTAAAATHAASDYRDLIGVGYAISHNDPDADTDHRPGKTAHHPAFYRASNYVGASTIGICVINRVVHHIRVAIPRLWSGWNAQQRIRTQEPS